MQLIADTAFVSAVGSSSAAFYGTPLARPQRTTDGWPLTSLTTVVRVDSFIKWGPAVDINPGDRVTVVVRDTNNLVLNKPYGFLGDGLAIDSGVVLEETWREDASTAARRSAFLAAYAKGDSLAQDRATHTHLSEIDVVFLGRVIAVAPPLIPDSVLNRNRGETAPGWRIATVVPRRVLRGNAALLGQPTRVLFPGTRHIIYALVPRPQVGDLQVYLLHAPSRFPDLSFAGIDTSGALVLYHPLDVRLASDTSRVAQILKFSSRLLD